MTASKMNKLIRSQSGLILPVLIILIVLTIIMLGIAGYLYFNNPGVASLEFVKQIKERIDQKVNINDQPQFPAEVAITKDGFVPASISIIAGQQVVFVNQDKNTHRIVPYPLATRNMLPELDSENLQPTDSFSYSFEKTGTFTISDDINLGKHKAIVIVN